MLSVYQKDERYLKPFVGKESLYLQASLQDRHDYQILEVSDETVCFRDRCFKG